LITVDDFLGELKVPINQLLQNVSVNTTTNLNTSKDLNNGIKVSGNITYIVESTTLISDKSKLIIVNQSDDEPQLKRPLQNQDNLINIHENQESIEVKELKQRDKIEIKQEKIKIKQEKTINIEIKEQINELTIEKKIKKEIIEEKDDHIEKLHNNIQYNSEINHEKKRANQF